MTRPRIVRYLTLAGAFPAWEMVLLVLLLIAGVAERWFTGRAETARNFVFVLFPIFIGTGLLGSARQGRLDLLLGAGESRSKIYWHAAVRAFALPFAIATILILLSSEQWVGGKVGLPWIRGLSIVALTGGVCFAAGMVQPTYLAGCLWIAARVAAMLSPASIRYMGELSVWTAGGPAAPTWKTVLALLVFPEVFLESRIPLLFGAVMAAVGASSLLFASALFRAADFAGKRQE